MKKHSFALGKLFPLFLLGCGHTAMAANDDQVCPFAAKDTGWNVAVEERSTLTALHKKDPPPLPLRTHYALVERKENGCWTIVQASRERPSRTSEQQEILGLKMDSKIVTPAFEDWTHWCFNSRLKNPSGYSPCSSKLTEVGVLNTLISMTIVQSEPMPPGASYVAASADKIRKVMTSIPDFDDQLGRLLNADDARIQAENDKKLAAREQEKLLQREADEAKIAALAQMESEHQKRIAKYLKAAIEWRKTVKVGIESHCGLVIQVRPSITQVQTTNGVHWLRLDQLFPPGVKCAFVNGVYVEPRLANNVP
jgi:hypothetical protein